MGRTSWTTPTGAIVRAHAIGYIQALINTVQALG
jgi:hypothetical protein